MEPSAHEVDALVAEGRALLRANFAQTTINVEAQRKQLAELAELAELPGGRSIDLVALQAGAVVVKVPTGRFAQPRETRICLSADGTAVVWDSKKKTQAACRIPLQAIDRIQKGQAQAVFARHAKTLGSIAQCARSFSIVYTAAGGEASLDIIAPDVASFALWTDALPRLARRVKVRRNSVSTDKSIEQMLWDLADADQSGSVDLREVLKVVPRLNLKLSKKAIQKMFKEVDADRSGALDHGEFHDMLQKLRRRPELEELWAEIVSGAVTPAHITGFQAPTMVDPGMATGKKCSRTKFIRFLKEVQNHRGEELALAEAELTEAVKPSVGASRNAATAPIDYGSFCRFMIAYSNNVVHGDKVSLFYFIYRYYIGCANPADKLTWPPYL